MQIRSLGLQTDLIFARFDGEVLDRGDHVVVRTPENPGFWWGNYLVFPAPPAPGDLSRWRALFAETFGDEPRIRHEAYAWEPADGSVGAAAEFVEAGFTLDESVVQVATAGDLRRPAKWNAEAEVRPVRAGEEWDAVLAAQIARSPPRHEPAGFADFLRRQWRRHEAMIEAGLGRWYGAFLDGELVADMGVFVEDALGRCQAVGTAAGHRRRGLCGTLVHGACSDAFEGLGAERVVIVADEHEHAAGIYRSVGFRDHERIRDLTKAPPSPRVPAFAGG